MIVKVYDVSIRRYLNIESQFLLLLGTLLPELEVLLPPGVLLGLKLLGLHLLCLLLEDGLDQHGSVLELVSLGGEVELVIEGSVDLLGLTVLPQQSPQDALPAHPQDLGGHSALTGSSPLSGTSVVALALGLEVQSSSGPGVYFLFALHNESVLDELPDEDPGVGLANLLNLIGVHPNSLLAALQHL